MRLYFQSKSINEIENALYNTLCVTNVISLIQKSTITKIYSTEGIFHLFDNKLNRAIIKDLPVEELKVNNTEFLLDKSTFNYVLDWTQLNPQHIVENINVYTYDLNTQNEMGQNDVMPNDVMPNGVMPNDVMPNGVMPNDVMPNGVMPNELGLVLIVEKKDGQISDLYLEINDNNLKELNNDINNRIVTFLSALNLC